MHVLLTGSAGTIGRPTAELLVERGHTLRTLERSAQPADATWEHQVGDLRDVLAVRQAVGGIDAVIHSGAVPSDRPSAPDEVLSVNVLGTLNVLQAAVEAGVKRVVYLSSVNALGSFVADVPLRRLPMDDDYPPHPATPYQLSKHLTETVCRYHTDVHGITTICLRPVAVLDEAAYDRWAEMDVEARAEAGRQEHWSYVDVRDVCDAIVRALESPYEGHVGLLLAARDSTMPVPTAQLVRRFEAGIPWPGPSMDAYLAQDPYRSLIDGRRATEVLGWTARHTWRTRTGVQAVEESKAA